MKYTNIFTLSQLLNIYFLTLLLFTGGMSEEIQNYTKQSMRDQIMNVIFKNYKNHERPTEEKNATIVIVYMKILAINEVEVRNMEYSTDVYLRQAWLDPRLAWNAIAKLKDFKRNIVTPILRDKVWLPDLFFRNGKRGYLHNMTVPNYLMRLQPDGYILYSQKITMRFSCQMDLHTFPMDEQECYMDIGSYGYTLDQLKFKWRDEEPIVLPKSLEVSEFNKPSRVDTIDCTKNGGFTTATGAYTCLKATFHLKRQLGSYLASTFIPNVLIIMVSWLNFWVSIDAVPARITLGLLTLLGILTQASTVSSSLPRVSYIKAIDIWTIVCIMFVIGTLVEFAVASTVSRKDKMDRWQKDVRRIVRQELARWCSACQQQQIQQNFHNFPQNSHATARRQIDFCEELESLLTYRIVDDKKDRRRVKNPPNGESDIDSYSRFLFPACFILYNCFYWLYYLILVHHI